MNGQSRYIKTGFILPDKGTRARKVILLALRPIGLMAQDAVTSRLVQNTNQLLTMMLRLECDCGFDIRRQGHKHSPEVIYRIVGKHRWSGSYRAFYPTTGKEPNVRQ